MKTTPLYVLVYQGGIANVFRMIQPVPQRILQSSFHDAEAYCLGLREAGADVACAWCAKAGDVSREPWHFDNFHEAPFSESFAWPGLNDYKTVNKTV